MGKGVRIFQGVEIFPGGLLFLVIVSGRVELRFSHGGVLEVTSRELNIFQRGVRIFGELENF